MSEQEASPVILEKKVAEEVPEVKEENEEKEVKIEVKNVTKVFGNNPSKGIKLLKEGLSKDEILKKTGQAVGIQDINFKVYEGEIFVVMGLSGSGKSTLIRCLNLLIRPTTGTIAVDGEDITTMKDEEVRLYRQHKQSMVFQQFALFPHRTIVENTAYGLEIQGVKKAAREEKARNTLEMVGLKGWEDKYPKQLSGGMQQRVGLARALTVDPDILLMDEAFSALDPLIRREMQDELLDLQQKMNRTIVFITHDLDEALKLGDRVALMKDGKIVQIDAPEDILTRPANDYVTRFVEDVDLSKVLTAESVMKSPGETALPKDGPRVAIRKMRDRGISSLFVTDRDRRLLGYVMAEDAARAAERGESDLKNILKDDVITVPPEMTLNEMFELSANAVIPIVVVGENREMKGIIVRGTVLSSLSKEGNGNND